MSGLNVLKVFPECSEKLYPNKRKFTVEQLLKADMVKSAFSAGKRVEHMWVKVFEVQVENHLVKGALDNTPTEITHLTLGDIVFVPFKDIEDIWIDRRDNCRKRRLLLKGRMRQRHRISEEKRPDCQDSGSKRLAILQNYLPFLFLVWIKLYPAPFWEVGVLVLNNAQKRKKNGKKG